MISPTIGRVVLYWPPAPNGRAPNSQPWPALICRVWGDRCVNIAGFNDGGTPFSMSSCPLLQDDDVPFGNSAYAEWMPYQKGQAAKTEALQAQIGGAQ